MIHGFNIRVDLYRDLTDLGDDPYGGSYPTSTIVNLSLPSRMDSYSPSQRMFAQQGMETTKSYSFYLHYNWQHQIDVRENDYLVVSFPPHHQFYQKKFRIKGIHIETGMHPSSPQGMIEVTAIRIDESRGNEF